MWGSNVFMELSSSSVASIEVPRNLKLVVNESKPEVAKLNTDDQNPQTQNSPKKRRQPSLDVSLRDLSPTIAATRVRVNEAWYQGNVCFYCTSSVISCY